MEIPHSHQHTFHIHYNQRHVICYKTMFNISACHLWFTKVYSNPHSFDWISHHKMYLNFLRHIYIVIYLYIYLARYLISIYCWTQQQYMYIHMYNMYPCWKEVCLVMQIYVWSYSVKSSSVCYIYRQYIGSLVGASAGVKAELYKSKQQFT